MDCKASNAPGKRSTKPHYRVGPVNYAFDIPAEAGVKATLLTVAQVAYR